MTVKPWAKAIATIPGRPTPSPSTAPAPAPMNINAKVPMNSARSLAAIRFDIVDSKDEIGSAADQLAPRERSVGLVRVGGAAECRQPASLFRGDRPRF